MVVPPAIAAADDLLAWCLRGVIEAGVPDVTLGGEVPEGGALNAENLRFNGGVDGLLIAFPGYDPGEEWVYRCVAVGATVQVSCADTLFHHAYAGLPPAELGGRILADARAHNDAFVKWRAQGGQPAVGEMRAIPAPRGAPASQALVAFVERRYRAGKTLADGPAHGWWVSASTPIALGAGIGVGAGQDPTYRLKGKVPVHELPEYREYAASIKTLGTVCIVTGVVGFLLGGLILTYAGYNVFVQRADIILTRGISQVADLLTANAWPLLSFTGALVFTVSMVLAGLRMRALRNLTLVRALLGVAAVPCSGLCCFGGLPVAGWALYKLMDDKAPAVFGRPG